jgi:hypothetical protein
MRGYAVDAGEKAATSAGAVVNVGLAVSNNSATANPTVGRHALIGGLSAWALSWVVSTARCAATAIDFVRCVVVPNLNVSANVAKLKDTVAIQFALDDAANVATTPPDNAQHANAVAVAAAALETAFVEVA